MGDRRIFWASLAIGVLLFASLVGVGTVDRDGNKTALVSSGDTTTTVAGTTDSTLVPGETTTTAAPGASTTAAPTVTTKPTTATTAAPSNPGGMPEVRPPTDGKYRTKTTVSANGDESTVNNTATITTLSKTASETKQKTENESEGGDSGNPFGGGGDFGGEASWRADGVYLRASARGENMQLDCQPAEQLQLKLPLAVGVAWTNDATCNVTLKTPQGEAKSKQHIVTNSKVTGTDTKTVAGRSLAVWIIESEVKTDGTTQFGAQSFANKGTEKVKQWFSPEIGLTVASESDGTQEISGQKSTTKSSSQLQNHSPE